VTNSRRGALAQTSKLFHLLQSLQLQCSAFRQADSYEFSKVGVSVCSKMEQTGLGNLEKCGMNHFVQRLNMKCGDFWQDG
jgi:hypothetical protein